VCFSVLHQISHRVGAIQMMRRCVAVCYSVLQCVAADDALSR